MLNYDTLVKLGEQITNALQITNKHSVKMLMLCFTAKRCNKTCKEMASKLCHDINKKD